MFGPMTKEEARAYRYGVWAGNPKGCAYNEKYCAFEVSERGGSFSRFHTLQCSRRSGQGPEGLFCGIHANMIARRIKK